MVAVVAAVEEEVAVAVEIIVLQSVPIKDRPEAPENATLMAVIKDVEEEAVAVDAVVVVVVDVDQEEDGEVVEEDVDAVVVAAVVIVAKNKSQPPQKS